MSWLLNLIISCVLQAISGIVMDLAPYINNIFDIMYQINNKLPFDSIITFFQTTSILLISVYTTKLAIDTYVLRDNGDSDMDPMEYITRGIKTVAVIVCGTWILENMIEFSAKATLQIASYINDFAGDNMTLAERLQATIDANKDKGLQDAPEAAVTGLVMIILLIVIVVCLILFIFKAAKRGTEIMFAKLLFPLFALDLMSNSRERWTSFFMDTGVCIFGYISQIVAFNIFMGIFRLAAIDPELNYMIAAVAWLVLSLNAPQMIKKYTYSSGTGNAVKSIGRTAMYTAFKR